MSDAPRLWYDLAELLERPDLLAPPDAVVPRMAWAERTTMLVAPPKHGKTTLVSCAAGEVARGGWFLGEPVQQGAVIWLALDEPPADAVRRFHDLGVTGGVTLGVDRPEPGELRAKVRETQARLVVIDTLHKLAAGIVEDFNRAEGWGMLFNQLRAEVNGTGAAILLIHHANKGTGEYTGSQAIAAAADAILTMRGVEGDETARKLAYQGRLRAGDFSLRFDGVRLRYDLDRGAPSLDAQVLAEVTRAPGSSGKAIVASVGARRSEVLAVLRRLTNGGYIEDRPGPHGAGAWYPREQVGNRSGTPGALTPGTAGNRVGTGGNPSGTSAEPAGVPAPPKGGAGNPPSRDPVGTALEGDREQLTAELEVTP